MDVDYWYQWIEDVKKMSADRIPRKSLNSQKIKDFEKFFNVKLEFYNLLQFRYFNIKKLRKLRKS